jgi:hypothetical protein
VSFLLQTVRVSGIVDFTDQSRHVYSSTIVENVLLAQSENTCPSRLSI